MDELYNSIKHIIILIDKYNNFFGAISDIVSIIVGIITGVSLIIGLSYIKSYREKTSAATFTFWSQIRIRIKEISTILETDNGLINNLYSDDLRIPSEKMSTQINDVNSFKEKIQHIIDYIESTPDQMPAYIGWTEDYAIFTEFLYDMIIYDICNSNDFFKFDNKKTKKEDIIELNKYCDEKCKVMNRICEKIKERQCKIEKRICKK